MPAARTLSSLDLLGVPVEIRCDVPEMAARLELCFARSATRTEGSGAGETASGETGTVLHARLRPHGAAFRVEVDGREPQLARDPAEGLRALNHELIQAVMLRASELYYVHAGVVSLRGAGVVLPGLSRSGKSTLSLALVRAGAGFLSDELLAFDPVRARALAFPRAFKIRDACVGYFPELAASFQGDGEVRFLPFEALDALELPRTAEIAAIVCPAWSGPGGKTELAPMTRGEALLELASSSMNFGTHRARSIDCLADLVGEARAYRLAWREPAEAVRLVLEAVAEARTDSGAEGDR